MDSTRPTQHLLRSTLLVSAWLIAAGAASIGSAQQAPELVFDPTWPKDLPNNWKLGGVTGLALDRDENVWLYNRPNDLTNIELHAELDPPLALCCVRAPSMIHLDRSWARHRLVRCAARPRHGRRQRGLRLSRAGHGTQVRSAHRRRRRPRSRARPSARTAAPSVCSPPRRRPGQGGRGPVAAFLPQPAARSRGRRSAGRAARRISREVSARAHR